MGKHTQTTRILAFVAAMTVVALAASGCIFDTRSAQRPPDNQIPQIPLDDAIDVFTSMKTGLEGEAMSNYQRALSDRFVFSPLLDDSLDQTFEGSDVFHGWDKDVEVDVTNLLFSEYDSVTVAFAPAVLSDENILVRYETTYSIRVVSVADGSALTYKGVAHMNVEREGGVWQLTYWDEIEKVEGASTWGFLRGILKQRL